MGRSRGLGIVVCTFMVIASLASPSASETVAFDSETWSVPGFRLLQHAGRTAATGFSYLEGVNVPRGVVEVDLYATGATSYPGFVFHVVDAQNYEHLYVRPHRAGRYPDAVQYTPCVNGISSWQLYNGDGFTAPVELPENEWVHLRLEFSEDQARLFVGDETEPVLHVKELKLGASGGSVGLQCPFDGSAYFADFKYRADDTITFDPVPPAETPPGTITEWEISQGIPMDSVDLEVAPSRQNAEIEWSGVHAEPSGLVNVGRYVGRNGNLPDCVFARATLKSSPDAADAAIRLEFGYSDAVSVFLNGELLFTASNAYRQRDPSALGIIGYFDALYLPLKPGDNVLELIVTESFGGWGFMARDGNAVYLAPSVEKAREEEGFFTPEAVLCDEERNVVYVSNYDVYRRTNPDGGQFLSKLSSDGTVLDAQWVGGLAMPTGMLLDGDRLLVVERRGLAEIDTQSGQVVKRHPLPDAAFPNDVAMDKEGRIYVSDTRANAIHRLVDGAFEIWLQGGEIAAPNALLVRTGEEGGELLIGNGGDSCLKSVDLASGDVKTLARFHDGNIDGIADTGDGTLLVSHWEGRLYRVSPNGAIEKLLDTSVKGANLADFGYSPEQRLVFAPTYYGDSIVTYALR